MPKVPLATFASICNKILTYYPDAKFELLQKAYHFAEAAHQGQVRSSGEPYLIHPTSVAQTLADLHLDMASIITGLLHDTVEDTSATLEQIEKEFGKSVAELVDGVTKLSKISFKTSEEKQAENFRKMIVAMAKDIRVVLVKLADRLNNMRTLEHLSPAKQMIIAQETLDIYAPIANRLGISWIKLDLEDLCLRFLHPDVYYRLATKIAKTKREREKYIEDVTHIVDETLKEYEIRAVVTGRAKNFYSIFRKMERRQVDFEQVFDLIAFRIVVDNITECYKSLGVIHAAYKPVPGRFKDYIAMPKANAYQSLHTTVIGPSGERVEIQIRTQEMHQVAEGGIAAHWKYKEGKLTARMHENIDWVHRLLEWQKDLTDPNEFLETVKIDLFAEDVFIFTPKGEVKQLSHGATPLDFAYAVHSDIGHKTIGAKVNGKIVPLKYRLKSGDTVEILTSPTQTPSKDWLKIVRTSKAKAKLRSYVKEQERERALKLGTEILEKSLRSFSLSLPKLQKSGELLKLLQTLNFKTESEFFMALGYGWDTPEPLIRKLVPSEALERKLRLAKEEDEQLLKKTVKNRAKKSSSVHAIIVAQVNDVLVRFGRCCSPLPGDSIMGFITRGRGVTVHSAHCAKALDLDSERRVDVQWNLNQIGQFKRQVRIQVVCSDEPGVLALISQTISAIGVNIVSAQVRTTQDKKAIALFDIAVTDLDQLQKITSALESKADILSVERHQS